MHNTVGIPCTAGCNSMLRNIIRFSKLSLVSLVDFTYTHKHTGLEHHTKKTKNKHLISLWEMLHSDTTHYLQSDVRSTRTRYMGQNSHTFFASEHPGFKSRHKCYRSTFYGWVWNSGNDILWISVIKKTSPTILQNYIYVTKTSCDNVIKVTFDSRLFIIICYPVTNVFYYLSWGHMRSLRTNHFF